MALIDTKILTQSFNSSNLSSGKYSPISKVLTINFNDGSRYNYSDVPLSVWKALTSATSAGSYFRRNIRTSYSYIKS